jgi:ssDNA-binding Zn-finger/Zn-ribbon topoisomerase 1
MNKIIYNCSKCGTEMVKTIGEVGSYGGFRIDLKCPECQYSTWKDDHLKNCHSCNGEMDKFKEGGHTVLRCSKCKKSWISPTPAFPIGGGWNNKGRR